MHGEVPLPQLCISLEDLDSRHALQIAGSHVGLTWEPCHERGEEEPAMSIHFSCWERVSTNRKFLLEPGPLMVGPPL